MPHKSFSLAQSLQRKIPFVAYVTARCHGRFRIRDVERALERFAVSEVH